MVILNSKQIGNKLQRIASEIYERHAESGEIILAGINTKGFQMASNLLERLRGMGVDNIRLARLKLNPARPLDSEVGIDQDVRSMSGKVIIVVDDVANSGRTLFFGLKPFTQILVKSLEVCVLIERMHKSYPISVDYVGLRLATTLKQNIEVSFADGHPVETSLV